MSARILISYSAPDAELGKDISLFLGAMIDGAEITEGDSLAALKPQLAEADAVVGLITPFSGSHGEVCFRLGAAWALGTRSVLLLGPEAGATELYLPIGQAEARVLGPEALLELAESLAQDAGLSADMGARAREVLARMFPEFPGLDRQSSERLVAEPRDAASTQPQWPVNAAGESVPPPSVLPRPGLPSCGESLHAGRAVSDCVFHRNAGGRFADELDRPFGGFLASLGTDWNALRGLDDLDVWVEAAENVLGKLDPSERHVRSFYEVGFQLATLINLANRALEAADGDAAAAIESWQSSWAALRESALQADVAAEAVDRIEPMLANLFGPSAERDFANLGRVQECVGEFAGRADAAVLAASA